MPVLQVFDSRNYGLDPTDGVTHLLRRHEKFFAHVAPTGYICGPHFLEEVRVT